MHVHRHHDIEQLRRMAESETSVARHRKLRAVILARQGWSAPQIAEALGKSRRTIQDWVYAYNGAGYDGLVDRRGGNRRYLTAEQEQQVIAKLDTADDPEHGIRHGSELVRWIEQQFGVLYSLSGIYELLDRLGYSWLRPRPRHPGADPEAQEAFKKKHLQWCKTSLHNTPANASNSGFRTKRDSANKAH